MFLASRISLDLVWKTLKTADEIKNLLNPNDTNLMQVVSFEKSNVFIINH